MRLAKIIVVVGLACLSGCMANRLRQRTINQGSTLTELQYQQVLGNLALFASNPAALPWHVNIREGTTQITDSANAGALVDLGPPAVTQPQVFGSRTAVAQWGMSPVIDTTELKLLRVAYRRACGAAEMPSPELLSELAQELKDQFAPNADLRNESELFYEFEGHASPTPWTATPRLWPEMFAGRSRRFSVTWSGLSPVGSASDANGTFRNRRVTSAGAAIAMSGSSRKGARL